MNKNYSGSLFVFEGIDGAGKSTLSKNLYNYLLSLNLSVILTREPGGSQLGRHIRSIIQDQSYQISNKTEFCLFSADRAEHIHHIIKPALNNGDIVISDRMGDSSLAYQGYGKGIDKNIIQTINKWVMDNITPDLTFYVRIPVKEALERCNKRGNQTVYEKKIFSFMLDVAEGFDAIYKNRDDVITLDGTKSVDVLNKEIEHIVQQYINK